MARWGGLPELSSLPHRDVLFILTQSESTYLLFGLSIERECSVVLCSYLYLCRLLLYRRPKEIIHCSCCVCVDVDVSVCFCSAADCVVHTIPLPHQRTWSEKHHWLHLVLLAVSQCQPQEPEPGTCQQQPEQPWHRSVKQLTFLAGGVTFVQSALLFSSSEVLPVFCLPNQPFCSHLCITN